MKPKYVRGGERHTGLHIHGVLLIHPVVKQQIPHVTFFSMGDEAEEKVPVEEDVGPAAVLSPGGDTPWSQYCIVPCILCKSNGSSSLTDDFHTS